MGPSYENDFSFLKSREDAMNTIRKVEPSSSGSSVQASSSRPSTPGRRRANSAVSVSNKLPPPSRSSGRRPTIHSIRELGLPGEYDSDGNFHDGDLEAGFSNQHHRQTSQPPPPSRRGRKGFKIHWPFQSVATDTLSIFTSFTSGTGSVSARDTNSHHHHHAHAGSQLPADFFPRRRGRLNNNYYEQYDDDKASIASPPRSALIPDYVVNFLRGETPESLAQRKHEKDNPTPPRRPGLRTVDVTYQHQPRRSHMAIMTRAEDLEDPNLLRRSHESHSSTATELQQILRDRNSRQPGRRGGWRGAMQGWRDMTLLNLILILVVFIAGFASLDSAATKTRSTSSWTGSLALFKGSCAEAAHINWGLHALVNVAAVALLGGANYIFQVLSSPTRSEVARMHERQRWMEIGIPSVRNLAAIGRGRAVLAVLVVVVAAVTQVMYNAVISTTKIAAYHDLVVVESSFIAGVQFSNASSANSAGLSREELLLLQSAASSNSLTNLTTATCAKILTDGIDDSEYSNILFVASETANIESNGNSLIATARVAATEDMNAALTAINLTSTSSSLLINNNTPISYCLAQSQSTTDTVDTCSVNLNGTLLATILALNLASLLLISATLFFFHRRRFHPLANLGDALSSFLRDPDPTTFDNALVTRQNYRWGLGAWGFTDGKYWSPSSSSSSSSTALRWLSSSSLAQLASVGFWWLATTALTTGFLILAIVSSVNNTATTKTPIILSPFGATSPQTTRIVIGNTYSSTTTAATLLTIAASTPQLLLSGLYLATNALLTSFYLSRESCLYSLRPGGPSNNHPRPLRVSSSSPVGLQTSSLHLTLPRPVSWMLLLWFMGMGFVLSQACVVVSVVVTAESQSSLANSHMLGIGLSGTALVILFSMLVLFFLALATLSARRLPAAIMADGRALGNPLALQGGSCSAVVSAWCHRLPDETDVWMNKVLWGVVAQTTDGAVAHVTYSARGVAELDGNHRYI